MWSMCTWLIDCAWFHPFKYAAKQKYSAQCLLNVAVAIDDTGHLDPTSGGSSGQRGACSPALTDGEAYGQVLAAVSSRLGVACDSVGHFDTTSDTRGDP